MIKQINYIFLIASCALYIHTSWSMESTVTQITQSLDAQSDKYVTSYYGQTPEHFFLVVEEKLFKHPKHCRYLAHKVYALEQSYKKHRCFGKIAQKLFYECAHAHNFTPSSCKKRPIEQTVNEKLGNSVRPIKIRRMIHSASHASE